MARVLVTRKVPGPALERLIERHEVRLWEQRLPPSYEELRVLAEDVEGMLSLLTDRIDRELIESARRLRVISNYAVGVDNVDLAAAAARGIPVGHTPDVLTDATADLTFALLLAASRGVSGAAREAAAGDWLTWEPGRYLGADVHGATLGIVGLGLIGRAVSSRAQGFSMEVLSAGRDGGLEDVLERSDFVSLHCPLTPETRGLISAGALGLMKTSAILVNTARGGIVDQAALADALDRGSIAGAALDVTDPEPLPPGDPLWSAPNLLITPHIGSATRTARERMTEIAVENLLRGLDGEPLLHQA